MTTQESQPTSATSESAWPIDWPAVEARARQAEARAASLLPTPEPLRLSEWADENFYLSPESSGGEGAWQTLPYQRAVMDVIGGDEVRVVTWMKSKRVGYTKTLIAALAYNASYKRRTNAIWEPKDGDARKLKKDEINPAMRDVPVFREAMLSEPEAKSPHNTESRVGFKGCVLHILGGKAPSNFSQMTLDGAYYDELDRFDQSISEAGSAVKLGDGRLTQSPFAKSVRGSTPRVRNESQIDSSFHAANIRMYRLLPCPECGHRHRLEFGNLQYEGQTLEELEATARFACPGCGSLFGYECYSEMDAAGRWEDESGNWIDESVSRGAPLVLRNADGEEIPWPRHVGFFIWSAYSYIQSWAELALLWVEANNEKKRSGSVEDLKTFINEELAETWVEDDDAIDADGLFARRESYAAEVPMSALALVMGVDTQDDRLEGEVVAVGEHGETWGIRYFVIHGDPADGDVWDQLDRERAKTYTHESGNTMRVLAVGVDSGGHRTKEVYEYCRTRHASKVYCLKGQGGEGVAIHRAPTKVKIRGSRTVKLYSIGVDALKARWNEMLKRSRDQQGYQHLPESYTQEWCEQATGEVYVRKLVRGRIQRWWKKLRARVEGLDCRIYAMAAFAILNPRLELMRPEPDTAAPTTDDDEPPRRRRRGGKRWSTSWR